MYSSGISLCVVPVRLGAGDGATRILHHRVVPEKQVAPHALHRRVGFHVRRVSKVRVHRRADEVCDFRPHASLRGKVVDLDPTFFHKLRVSKSTALFSIVASRKKKRMRGQWKPRGCALLDSPKGTKEGWKEGSWPTSTVTCLCSRIDVSVFNSSVCLVARRVGCSPGIQKYTPTEKQE